MHLLSTQLESQRKYWEERIVEVEHKQESRHQELLARQRDTEKTVDELQTQVSTTPSFASLPRRKMAEDTSIIRT